MSMQSDIPMVVITVAALFVAVYSSYLQRKQSFRSVRPVADFEVRQRPDKLLIRLENHGTGPMRIISVLFITRDGANANHNLIKLISKDLWDKTASDEPWRRYSGLLDGDTIPPGSGIRILKLEPTTDEQKDVVKEIKGELREIYVEVEYMDMYEKKYFYRKEFIDSFPSADVVEERVSQYSDSFEFKAQLKLKGHITPTKT